jgi:radical SAM superfamily enzyme YgiQ (UPF0313 family)
MKVVLVYPTPIPVLSKSHNESKEIAGLGLLYLATVIKDNHDVTIIGGTERNPAPTEEIIEQVTALKPDILGISNVFSTLVISGKLIAKEIRKRFPQTKIIFGGNHATFIADELVMEDYVDVVVAGEGEVTFKELVEKIDKNQSIEDTKGIVYRKNGKIIRTAPRPPIKDINSIPFLDWRVVYDGMPRSIPMCSSRGCPHDCIYCSTTAFWGRKWRFRSARNMIDEILNVFDMYGSNEKKLSVAFVDDNFTVNKKRVVEFCRLVHEENLELTWGASSRIEMVDEELLAMMSDAGCTAMFFGIESGSPRVLSALKRHYTPDEAKEKVDMCVKYGILPTCSFMIGNPYEDKSDIEKTFSLLKVLKSYKVQTHIFTPLIGTEVYNNAEKYQVELLTQEFDTAHLEAKALLNTQHLKAKEIESLYQRGVGYVLKRYREAQRVGKIVKQNKARRAELNGNTTLEVAS